MARFERSAATGAVLRAALVAGAVTLTMVVSSAVGPVRLPVAPVLAQDATQLPDAARPVHLHTGSCNDLGDIAADLTDATLPEGDFEGADTAIVAETSFTRVPLTLDELTGSPHAIEIAASADAPEQVIACGDIGGVFDELGAIIIGLSPRDNSGYSGVAFLAPDDANARTNISVFLSNAGAANAGSPVAAAAAPTAVPTAPPVTPAATPGETSGAGAPGAATPGATPVGPTPVPTATPIPSPTPTPTPVAVGGAINVTLREWSIDMPERLKAGPVAFVITNDGAETHNFVMANDTYNFFLDNDLKPGETGTLTFNLPPGIYTVSCPLGDGEHAAKGMTRQVEVVDESGQ